MTTTETWVCTNHPEPINVPVGMDCTCGNEYSRDVEDEATVRSGRTVAGFEETPTLRKNRKVEGHDFIGTMNSEGLFVCLHCNMDEYDCRETNNDTPNVRENRTLDVTRVTKTIHHPGAAEERASAIKDDLELIAVRVADVGTLLRLAQEHRDWQHFGYTNFTEYLDKHFEQSRQSLYRAIQVSSVNELLSLAPNESVTQRQAAALSGNPDALEDIRRDIADGMPGEEALVKGVGRRSKVDKEVDTPTPPAGPSKPTSKPLTEALQTIAKMPTTGTGMTLENYSEEGGDSSGRHGTDRPQPTTEAQGQAHESLQQPSPLQDVPSFTDGDTSPAPDSERIKAHWRHAIYNLTELLEVWPPDLAIHLSDYEVERLPEIQKWLIELEAAL